MANENGKITEPIRLVDDIKAVLNAKSNDLGTLCTSGNIKKWAKCKPINYNSLLPIGDVERESINWGLTFQRSNNLATLFSGYLERLSWDYDRPKGDINSPFRMSDFVGYNHNVPDRVFPFIDGSFTAYYDDSQNIKITPRYPLSPYIQDAVRPQDIILTRDMTLEDAYLGLALRQNPTQPFRFVTNSIKGLTAPLEFHWLGSPPSGTWQGWLFASSIPILQGDVATDTGWYMSLDQSIGANIKFEKLVDNWSIRVHGEAVKNTDTNPSLSGRYWNVYYDIYITTTQYRTFPDVTVYLLNGATFTPGNEIQGVLPKTHGNVVVNANETKRINGAFLDNIPLSYDNLFLYVKAGDAYNSGTPSTVLMPFEGETNF